VILLCEFARRDTHLTQCISLNNLFAEHIRASPIFQLVTPPSFALTVFRLLPRPANTAGELDSVNSLNREFYNNLQSHSSLVLTQTLIGEVFCVRLAVGASSTEQSDIEDAWGVIRDTGETTLKNLGYAL
jgi:aromatic-L-amino-acid decarboxylase